LTMSYYYTMQVSDDPMKQRTYNSPTSVAISAWYCFGHLSLPFLADIWYWYSSSAQGSEAVLKTMNSRFIGLIPAIVPSVGQKTSLLPNARWISRVVRIGWLEKGPLPLESFSWSSCFDSSGEQL
jgi:hypothetical protein